MYHLSTDEVVDKLCRVDVFQGVVTHHGLGEVGKGVQSLFVQLVIVVLDGESLGMGHASGVHQLDLNLAKLLVIGSGIHTEHIGSFGNESETTRHRDSCHCLCPPYFFFALTYMA